MTDQQPHTPEPCEHHWIHYGQPSHSPIRWIVKCSQCNQFRIADLQEQVAAIEAAAEQRGAIKALRDAAGAIEKNQIMTQVGHLQPCNSCMVIHMDFLDYRADLLEGDDE